MLYGVQISWRKNSGELFIDNKYSRSHTWTFDGGMILQASSSPHVVPVPLSDESAVDPEEAFVAALSSCHLLWFLSLAAGQNYIVESYQDNAVGTLAKNEEGNLAMTEVTLHPAVKFGGNVIPSLVQANELHHLAHKKCFIASSVKTKITIISIVKQGN